MYWKHIGTNQINRVIVADETENTGNQIIITVPTIGGPAGTGYWELFIDFTSLSVKTYHTHLVFSLLVIRKYTDWSFDFLGRNYKGATSYLQLMCDP